MFDSYLNESILSRAVKNSLVDFSFYNPRDFVEPTEGQKQNEKPYLRVDDKVYGGGPGMVLQAMPMLLAVEEVVRSIEKRVEKEELATKKKIKQKTKIIFFSPSGKKLDTAYAKNTSKKYTDIVMICGRYEGVDARVPKILKADHVSVGDYVLTGGELPAMLIIDTISRQIEGVLGTVSSLEESRFASSDVYTRPEVIEYKGKKHRVPKVLVGGNHKEIEKWRAEQN